MKHDICPLFLIYQDCETCQKIKECDKIVEEFLKE